MAQGYWAAEGSLSSQFNSILAMTSPHPSLPVLVFRSQQNITGEEFLGCEEEIPAWFAAGETGGGGHSMFPSPLCSSLMEPQASYRTERGLVTPQPSSSHGHRHSSV